VAHLPSQKRRAQISEKQKMLGIRHSLVQLPVLWRVFEVCLSHSSAFCFSFQILFVNPRAARSLPAVFTWAMGAGTIMGVVEWAGGFRGVDGAVDSYETTREFKEKLYGINQRMPLSEFKSYLGIDSPTTGSTE
jgi:hypothetical protein